MQPKSFWADELSMQWPEFNDYEIRCDAFVVEPGQKLAIEAPSGFGKTTLIRMIAGLEKSKGHFGFIDEAKNKVRIDQKPIHERSLGILFQDQLLLSHLDARENVALALRLKGNSKKEALAKAENDLIRIGLGARMHASITELSGGERQRVALLRALFSAPQLLILDEPYKGLDVESQKQIEQFMHEKLRLNPIPLIIISHQPESSDIRLVGKKPNDPGKQPEKQPNIRWFRFKTN